MDITHVKKREIQAPLAKCLLEGFIKHLGRDKALSILQEIIKNDAEKSAQELAKKYGNSMKSLARVVHEVWAVDDAMEMEFIEESDQKLKFNVTRCRYIDAYHKNDMQDLGVYLSCNRDIAFAPAFNPDFQLIRSKTLMEGDDCCDFCFIKNKN